MNRGVIRDNVRLTTLLESTSVSTAELDALIDQVNYEIGAAAKWPFLQTSSTISTTVSGATYALPTDFWYGAKLIDVDNDVELELLSAEQAFKLYGDGLGSTTTTATEFWLWGTNIQLYPLPSAIDADRYKLYYYKTISVFANDAAVPQFDAAFHWLLVDGVKAKLWEREEYWEQAERSRINYERRLNDMIQYYINRFRSFPFVYGDGKHQRLTDANFTFLNGV